MVVSAQSASFPSFLPQLSPGNISRCRTLAGKPGFSFGTVLLMPKEVRSREPGFARD